MQLPEGKNAVKVIGERNSGTNLLDQLFLQLDDVATIRSTAPTAVAVLARKTASEAPLDYYFKISGNRKSGGWKHACGELVARYTAAHANELAIVASVRDPWAWLASMHRRPYHWPLPALTTFSEFLATPISLLGRESLQARSLTPVELWNTKIASYTELSRQRDRAVCVRYEDMLFEPGQSFTALLSKLGLETATSASLPSHGVKRMDAHISVDEYKRRYLEHDHMAVYTAADIDRVAAKLDPELLERYAYPAGPELSPGSTGTNN